MSNVLITTQLFAGHGVGITTSVVSYIEIGNSTTQADKAAAIINNTDYTNQNYRASAVVLP